MPQWRHVQLIIQGGMSSCGSRLPTYVAKLRAGFCFSTQRHSSAPEAYLLLTVRPVPRRDPHTHPTLNKGEKMQKQGGAGRPGLTPATDRCQPRPCPCSYRQIWLEIRHAGCVRRRPERRTMLQIPRAPCPATHTAWSTHQRNQQWCVSVACEPAPADVQSSHARIHSQISKRTCACAARAVRRAATRALEQGKNCARWQRWQLLESRLLCPR